MNTNRFSIRHVLIVTAVLACVFAVYSVRLREAERVRQAQRESFAQIFERCQSIAELKQFIELYKPKEALEFFDNGKVVSVVCVTPVDDRFDAAFNAPVLINSKGTYDLAGNVVFSIEDRNGTFRKIHAGGWSDGPSVRLNAKEWLDFVDGGADIESLRTTNETPSNLN